MHLEVPLTLEAIPGTPSADALRDYLCDFYTGSDVINVSEDRLGELVLRAHEHPHDDMELMVFASDDGTQARLVARLDNLGKGASGAAVQNLNLMAGLDETTGLKLS